MKLSTKGRYASRLMLDLALNYDRRPVFLRDIAKRQEISEKYLGQLTLPLKAAGLINSIRGAHGGYALARRPQDITLKEVVLAVEGDLNLVECLATPKMCHRADLCVTRDIWSRLTQKMTEVLESTTLQDMVKMQSQKQQFQPLIYSI